MLCLLIFSMCFIRTRFVPIQCRVNGWHAKSVSAAARPVDCTEEPVGDARADAVQRVRGADGVRGDQDLADHRQRVSAVDEKV